MAIQVRWVIRCAPRKLESSIDMEYISAYYFSISSNFYKNVDHYPNTMASAAASEDVLWFTVRMIQEVFNKNPCTCTCADANGSIMPCWLTFSVSILCRLFGLSFILLLQLWVGWTFLHYQMERSDDKHKQGASSAAADSGGH